MSDRLTIFLIMLLWLSCLPERNNPWDEGADPASWAPDNLDYEIDAEQKIVITWDYKIKTHHGFKIDRKEDGQNWENSLYVLDAYERSMKDESAEPQEFSYTYRVYAFVDNTYSNKKELLVERISDPDHGDDNNDDNQGDNDDDNGDDNDDDIGNDEELNIGDFHQGGIIAYIFQSGDSGYVYGQVNGIIVAPSDQSAGAQWGCNGTSIATSAFFGTGKINTELIIEACNDESFAALICYELDFNDYTDWFLPSIREWEKIYPNRHLIGGFEGEYYWSSSQAATNRAWRIKMDSGYSDGFGFKDQNYRVRAARYF